jgi:hypothetical protein
VRGKTGNGRSFERKSAVSFLLFSAQSVRKPHYLIQDLSAWSTICLICFAARSLQCSLRFLSYLGGKMINKKFRIGNLVVIALVGLTLLLGASATTNGQTRRDIEREQRRIERQNAKYQRDQQRRNRNDRNSTIATRRTEQQNANSSYGSGYDQGFQAGQYDRRSGKYNRSNVYRDTGSSPNDGDPTSIDFVYRQGYLKGYNDGFYGERNY